MAIPFIFQARRSMRFSKQLIDLGNEFREKFLDSTDKKDKTVLKADWTKTKVLAYLFINE